MADMAGNKSFIISRQIIKRLTIIISAAPRCQWAVRKKWTENKLKFVTLLKS